MKECLSLMPTLYVILWHLVNYSLCDTMAFSERDTVAFIELTVALNGTKVGALVRGTRTHQLDHCFGGCKVCFRRNIF